MRGRSTIGRINRINNIINDYTSDGRKLSSAHKTSIIRGRTITKTSNTTDLYIDGLIVRNGTPLLWQFDGGYVSLDANGTPTSWNYYVTDHLGSTRMVVDSNNNVKETINYYPFGSEMKMEAPAQMQQTDNNWHPFRFTGKELDKQNGLNMYDFGARLFDVAGVPMWTSVDPLAEKYYPFSPYSYCAGDPVNKFDPTGMDYWSTSDPKEIDTFFKTVQSNGLADANMEKWDHTSDANFIANLSYNDKTQKFWYSSCNIENGEVVCTGKSFSAHVPVTLDAINSLGKSLAKNAGNSTIGNNGNFYWHAAGERGFYGNQYVSTTNLAKVGRGITKVTGPVGMTLGVIDISKGYIQDGGKIGYHTARATANYAGGWAGATAGAALGAKAGLAVGVWFCGVGAAPGIVIGSMVGGAAGGIAGSFGGSWIGTSFVDMIYGY